MYMGDCMHVHHVHGRPKVKIMYIHVRNVNSNVNHVENVYYVK